MSSENELNKALAELYSDLEKLQSARKQVELVSESSNELAKSTSTLINQISEFTKRLGKDNSLNISNLKESLVQFETQTNDLKIFTKDAIEQMLSIAIKKIENQEQVISKTIGYIEKSNSKTESLIDIISKWEIPKILDQFNQKFDSQKNINNFFLILILLLSVVGSISSILMFLK